MSYMTDEYPYIDKDMMEYFGKEVTVMACEYDTYFDTTTVKILEDNMYHKFSVDWLTYKPLIDNEELFEI
jgi:hypothetical protein